MTDGPTWAEIKAKITDELKQRKTVIFNDDWKFVIKMLTQKEYDMTRATLSMETTRGKGTRIPLQMGEFNRALIRYGVVEGPEGFNSKNPQDIEILPVDVRDKLAQLIEEFSSLDEVTRCLFRSDGEGGKIDTDKP